ncbi:hypothetical protein [Pleomorphomonas koreensis]|uniref:hypothetical protein n=1 Tax=Pleomorphomonas koreensis TaxID=257440 RepID=UPI000404CE05|nr:hypothetical protein [Pleomorphomonas koreensis]
MILARLLGVDLSRLKRRGGIVAAAAAFAAVMATLAIAFAAFAGYIALARHFRPENAALIVAGVLLFLALIGLLIVRQVAARARREMRSAVASSAAVAFAPTAASMAVKHTRLAAVAVLAGLGFWLARNVAKR